MKLKYLFLLLIFIFLTSCNVSNNKSEKIYYLDGLASNLFVHDVMEEYMNFTYEEETDSYHVSVCYSCVVGHVDYNDQLGVRLNGKDIVIPNVYDDGVHGFKRVKSLDIQQSTSGYINSLVISEGIMYVESMLLWTRIINIYLPSTIKELIKFSFVYDRYFSTYTKNGEKINGTFDLNICYNGTKKEFSSIKLNYMYEDLLYNFGGYIKIDCLDGYILEEFLGDLTLID